MGGGLFIVINCGGKPICMAVEASAEQTCSASDAERRRSALSPETAKCCCRTKILNTGDREIFLDFCAALRSKDNDKVWPNYLFFSGASS